MLGVVPARYGSSRFPGKPLARVGGITVVEHAFRRLKETEGVGQVVVATDDTRVAEAVRAFGGEAVLSSRGHHTGTDRAAEVAAARGAELVVNLQLDQPFLSSTAIDEALRALRERDSFAMSTLVRRVSLEEARADPDGVTVVTDRARRCLYFSRAPLPPQGWEGEGDGDRRWVWQHIGLYCYRSSFLLKLAGCPRSPLERAEGLEQLRALEEGGEILAVPTRERAFWLHRPQELPAAESFVGVARAAAGKPASG